MSAKEKLYEKFPVWSAKTGMPEEMLVTHAKDSFERAKLMWASLDEETLWTRTANIMGAEMASEMKSDAKLMNIYFFSVGEKRDLSAADFEAKKTAFLKDPEKAVAEGQTDNQGTPMDTREFYPNTTPPRPNPSYKKVLKPFFQRVAFGVGKPITGNAPLKFATARMRGKQADLVIPPKRSYQGRFNLQREDEVQYSLTSSQLTKLIPTKFPELEGLSIAAMLQAVKKEYKSSPLDLADYKDAHKDRFAVVEGDLISPVTETSNGNLRFSLGDGSNPDFAGITVFAPMDEAVLKCGPGSRLIVLGNPADGTDPRDGSKTLNLNGNVSAVVYMVESAQEMFEADLDV